MKKLFLIFSFLICAFMIVGCKKDVSENTNDSTKNVVEEEKKTDENTDAKEDEKLDFSGRTLNVIATSEKYQKLFDLFTEKTGAKVEFLSMSSGDVLSRIKAEGKPVSDLWFGGGLDAFLSAKESGFLDSYIPKEADKVDERFRDKDGYWIAKGLTVVGLLVNEEMLKEKGLEVPKTLEEIKDPKYKDLVIMSTPEVSGTMFAFVKGILDKYGEEEGYKYLEELNNNIPFYGKRGKDPQEKTVAGEFAIGIIPIDKSAFDAAKEYNLTAIYPEDGIAWVPEGVAVFKDAPGSDMAKAFIDFMLLDENQELLAELDGKDGNQMIKQGVSGYKLGLDKALLIDEKIEEFGSKRDEILNRFKEITKDK